MTRMLSLIAVSIILTFPVASAQIEKVDERIQLSYRHIVGQPLAEAIAALDSNSNQGQSKGNITVRFNGGGPNNNLYIGERNTLEILITNSEPLAQFEIGFSFRWGGAHLAPPWTRHHGQYPDSGSAQGVVLLQPELAKLEDAIIDVSVGKHDLALYIKVKTGATPIAIHDSPALLFSLELILPLGLTESVHELGVVASDNPMNKKHSWMLTTTSGERYAPLYNGLSTRYGSIGNLQIAEFASIDRKLCIDPPLSTGMIPPDSLELNLRVHTGYPFVKVFGDGQVTLSVLMKFTGDEDELTSLGVRIDRFRMSGNRISANIPIQILPKVLRVPGIARIYSSGGMRER